MKAGTNLEKVLESGRFAVTAEAGPPKGASAAVIQRKGELLRPCCDAINVTDNQTAPMNNGTSPEISSPQRNFFSSRIFFRA